MGLVDTSSALVVCYVAGYEAEERTKRSFFRISEVTWNFEEQVTSMDTLAMLNDYHTGYL